MEEYALRNIVGFLVQIVPCAVLCFLPFTSRLRVKPARAAGIITLILIVALVPFAFVGSGGIPSMDQNVRYTVQNALFFATLAALLTVYARTVDATIAQKLFVFFLVMCYGYLVTQTEEYAVSMLTLDANDGYMYAIPYLQILIAMNVVFFVPMAGLMRYLSRMLTAPVDNSTWKRMTILPVLLMTTMFFGGHMPGVMDIVDRTTQYYLFALAVEVLSVGLMWWMLITVSQASKEVAKRTQLENALEQHVNATRSLESQLNSERERANKLEESLTQINGNGNGSGNGSEAAHGLLAIPAGVAVPTAPAAPAGAAGATGATAVNASAAATVSAEASGASTSARVATATASAAATAFAEAVAYSQPIVVSTPTQAISFRAKDVLYAESLNRTRIVHLVGGENFQINTTLAQIVEKLPTSKFIYCHRSVVVNLDYVLSVEGDELTLRGGTKIPVSRRRLQDVREALAARAR